MTMANIVKGTFSPEPKMPNGAIYIYNYGDTSLTDEEAVRKVRFNDFGDREFRPLGIEYEPKTSKLYAINHAQTGSAIEIFKLDTDKHSAQHIRTVKHPYIHTPNCMHVIGDDKIFFTNDHYLPARTSKMLSTMETFSGAPGGSVVYMDLNNPDSAKTLTRIAFANGIAMLNSTTLAVGSSSKPGIYFYEVTPEYNLKYQGYLRTPVGVDNISVDGDGKILMAGHPFVPTLVEIAARRTKCSMGSENEEERKACECEAPGWAAEWSEKGGLKELYKGYDVCTSSTVIRDTKRGIGFISMLYGKGIVAFKE
jgi:arylesterase / paraoxonase